MAHPHSFKGHFFGAKINGANLKTRRFENAPAILGGARIPGVFLGKKSSLNFDLNGENLRKISLTVRTRQETGELFAIQNASKGKQKINSNPGVNARFFCFLFYNKINFRFSAGSANEA